MEKSYPLGSLIDLDVLQSIQGSFARAAGISSVIFSPLGEPVTKFTNMTGFCSLIQSTRKGKDRCFRSIMEMGKIALESREQRIFYCFAHGGNFIVPIMINGKHKGTIFAGHFIPEKFSHEQLHDLEKIAVEIELDPELLLKEAEKMRVIEEDVITNYSDLLFKIIQTIAKTGSQAAELIRANDALKAAYEGMEKRVQERTAELADANKELEREIAERKAVEKKIQNLLRYNRGLIETSLDPLVTFNKEGIILDVNKATIRATGRTMEELIGTPFADYFTDTERAHKGVMLTFETGEVRDYELVMKAMDGTETVVSYNASLYINQAGESGVFAAARDITAQKAAENEIKKKANELEKFNRLAVDRELKMIELKKQINALLEELGREHRYKIVGNP